MFIDPTEKILDMDDKEIKLEQKPVLPPKTRVAMVAGVSVYTDGTGAVLFDGGPAPVSHGKSMTFGYLAVQITMAQFDGDDKLTGPQKMDRFELAEKFHGAMMPVEISNDQAQTLLRLAEKGLPFLTYARFKRLVAKAEARSGALPAAKPNGKGERVKAGQAVA